jgi:flagellar motor switch protein FliM
VKARGTRGTRGTEHTVMIQAPAFSKAGGRGWKPFRFTNLEKVSKRRQHLLRNLEWLLPNVPTVGEVAVAVRRQLKDILEEEVGLETEFIHVVPLSKLRAYVGEPTFLAVLSPQPNKTRALLEIELGLAHKAIDLLLGGVGEAIALRPLTDIEEGMMTYLVIETLRALAGGLDATQPKLRLEALAHSYSEVSSLIGEDESLVVVQLKASFGSHAGYVRLFIPELVLASLGPPADPALRKARWSADAQAGASRLRNVRAQLRVEIGQVEISGGELRHLREGDVVLVDGLTCRPDLGQGGEARIKVGLGRVGHIEATITVADGRFKAEVRGIVLGAPPRPAAGDSPEAPGAAPALGELPEASTSPGVKGRDDVEGNPEGADLMNDIPLQISVELARVPVTGEEIVGIKVGQVFDLNRTAAEPLELSVNGRVVARGELVEVDGNLGVRILSLVG